jgi:hypothetical protein
MRSTLAVSVLLLAAGCQAPAPDGDAMFVALSRGDTTVTRAQLTSMAVPSVDPASESFYLAVNKKTLGQRFFLSAYLQQYFPGTVGGGAANSLGTRVVTFRVQNDKLFVFDASDAHKTSDTFDPTLILEAYPIVASETVYTGLAYPDRYVVIDPAAGLNRFSVLSDAYAGGSSPEHFQVSLAFLQRFRSLPDGAAWEQVFTGFGDQGDTGAPDQTEPNEFRASGTLGIALRSYQESPGFVPAELPPKEFYFRSDLRIVANEGLTTQNAIKWNIHPGMKPITWLLSPQFAALANDPAYAQYDILGAVKAGVENWNQVFGFQVLQAKVADPSDSFSDDDKNYIIYDADPTYGYAFANWRSNPNTGEVRGASIYFNGIWLEGLDRFTDDNGPVMNQPAPPTKTQWLAWDVFPDQRLCNLPSPGLRPSLTEDGSALPAPPAVAALTGKEKAERYITHTILHEVGHTLGLRHNFMGSLAPPSSSVMDYLLDDDGIQAPVPQHYDIAAIRHLYGLDPALPTDAFCTDEDTATNPDCATFDQTKNPLVELYIPAYQGVLNAYLSGTSLTAPNTTLNNVLKYVRAGSAAQRTTAFSTAVTPVHAPADAAALAATPGLGARIDTVAHRILQRLYLDPATVRGSFSADPPADPTFLASVLVELRGNIENLDGVRSFPTRRTCVDVLKKLQTQDAYNILVEAKAKLATEKLSLGPADQALADDLLARIDAAIHPYFAN